MKTDAETHQITNGLIDSRLIDPDSRLIDTMMRRINYLRISITDRCNLRCAYCTPARPFKRLSHRSILRYEEILRVARIGTELGITKIRVTGGEPLVRRGSIEFLENLGRIPGIIDLSLTTNGILLDHYLERLADIGIRRLNISLDTLDPEKYRQITGHDGFHLVWRAIMRAVKIGFSPIKINVVALNGINSDEIEDLAALTYEYPLHVRFIEHMPFAGITSTEMPPLMETDIRSRVSALGTLHPVERERIDGPARRYRLEGAVGEIGFISAMSHHFCSQCNRLRLTADGQLRSCLLSDAMTDIKTPMRAGVSDQEIAAAIVQAVMKKPLKHTLLSDCPDIPKKMYSIGG